MRLLVLVAGAASALGACATVPQSCRGLPPGGPATLTLPSGRNVVVPARVAQADVAELRCGADQGLLEAQVALGRRYESGDGVPLDVARAAELYKRAAAAVPSNTAIYSPPVKLGGSGRVLLVPNANAGPGSAEAQYRLGRLLISGEGVPRDIERGRALLERAAEQGHAAAAAELDMLLSRSNPR